MIGTFLGDAYGQQLKTFFMNKNLYSDITFQIEGKEVHAHKVSFLTVIST